MCRKHPDPDSFANIDAIQQRHLDFDWNVDFDKHIIDGSVTIDAVALQDGVSEFVCDKRYDNTTIRANDS